MNTAWKEELAKILNKLRNEPQNPEQWKALYNHTFRYVYADNYQHLDSNHALAEETTQKVFLGLVKQIQSKKRSFHDFDTPEAFCNYLLVASRHRRIDKTRSPSQREVHDEQPEAHPSNAKSPEDLAIEHDLQCHRLATLSPEDREIAQLVIFGHKIKDIIAMKAGKWTPSYVYTRISRMRRKFTQTQTPGQGEDEVPD